MNNDVDSEVFRRAMAALPTGVSVLTTSHDTGFRGMTVGSLTSVSLAPPLILVCLRKESSTLGLIGRNSRFALSILAADQNAIADTFASPDRGAGVVGVSFMDDVPVISGAVGWLVCRHRHTFTAGDHAIVLGAVTHAESRDGEPLIRHRSRYRHLNSAA